MTAWLRTQGETVNPKRVRRLLRLMGLEAIYPKPNLSKVGDNVRRYPYLLRELVITAPNQVWSTDIPYIRMNQGFLYLTAVIDGFSQYVLSWRLSNTLEVGFCLEALEVALCQSQPQIFNTDQGAQFTSAAFTQRLEAQGIAISQDGRGRALDNIFVERLWRSVKSVACFPQGGGLSEVLWVCSRGDIRAGCLFPLLQPPALTPVFGVSDPCNNSFQYFRR